MSVVQISAIGRANDERRRAFQAEAWATAPFSP
jgi:hypothetical protein